MPQATTDDGIKLYYEEAGAGITIIFVHEFAGDYRSWEAQMRYFSRRYRCVTFSARGYPGSDIPENASAYSQSRARDDIRDVLDHLNVDQAHVVGLSMGGAATLQFGLTYPGRARSLVLASAGAGSEPDRVVDFRANAKALADVFLTQGSKAVADTYGRGPSRVQYMNKDPRGHAEFAAWFAEHSPVGSANTSLGVQGARRPIWDQEAELRALDVPALIVIGDEDEACIRPALFMKRTIAGSGLVVFPRTGHCVSQEEPDLFNRSLAEFFAQVEAGRWTPRDPRAEKSPVPGFPD